jgi:hypothetical protein
MKLSDSDFAPPAPARIESFGSIGEIYQQNRYKGKSAVIERKKICIPEI